jgi:hypothetical protein
MKKPFTVCFELPENIKSEYLSDKAQHAHFVVVEVYEDKRFGAVAKLFERNSVFDRYDETVTKKQKEKLSFAKIKSDSKPVDTSNWVKPDEESLKQELVKSLFLLEILEEDCNNWIMEKGRADVLYSILHSHSPKNPQSLSNFAYDPFFKAIMGEFKSPEWKKFWADFNKDFDKKKKSKNHWEKRREKYQKWKEMCLKKMIIKDPKL